MKRVKIAYIISDIENSLAFEWIAKKFVDFDLTFILIGSANTALEKTLNGHTTFYVIVDGKFSNPFITWFSLIRLIHTIKPQIIHTHLWRANVYGQTASWFLRIPKRVFTRHHATIHYEKYPSGLKWDKLCNFLATDIIAISKNVQEILIDKDGADPKKIHLIHHGFDLDYFKSVAPSDIENLRVKYRIDKKKVGPVIGVVARYVDWKGIQYIIPSFRRLREKYPSAHLVLANANGDYSTEIRRMLGTLPVESYTEIIFEENIAALYRLFDIYTHVPVNSQVEAFGQTYVEALASGVPAVFTLSGIASEFIVHEQNALVAAFQDVESVVIAIERILTDESLRTRIIGGGKKSTLSFSIDGMINKLRDLYKM
jgi:glycosyltransferase involved in cell wall biosynthesis